jgi:WD40 repeat protein
MRCKNCNKELDLYADTWWMCAEHGQQRSIDDKIEPLTWLDEVVEHYPYPIAHCYRTLREDIEIHSDPRDGLRQLIRIKDVIETLVKYLAIIQLAVRVQQQDEPDALDRQIVEKLVAPALGTWDEGILRPLAKAAHELGDSRLDVIYEYLFAKSSRVRSDLQEFTSLHNRVICHGMVRNPREDQADVHYWVPKLNDMLSKAGFLARWELVQLSVDPISWMGAKADVVLQSLKSSKEVLQSLAGRKGEFALIPDSGEPFSIHPFIYLLGCRSCAGIERLFFYDGQKEYSTRKRIAMLEIKRGHKEVFTEPVEPLENLFTAELLAEYYRRYRHNFEVLEGKMVEFDFDSYHQRHREFVGRKFVSEWIRSSLTNYDSSFDRGYLLLTGEAGIGKTAFLTHWIDNNEFDTLPVRFYYSRGRNLTPFDFVRHCYHQLLLKHNIEDTDHPQEPNEYPRKLDSLLKTISEKYLAIGQKEIIVIDGIDEAGDTPQRIEVLKAIPRELPPGIYFLISSRPVKELDILNREMALKHYKFDAGDKVNREDVRQYLKLRLRDFIKAEYITSTLMIQIEKATAGNFLWAEQFTHAVKQGMIKPDQLQNALPCLSGLESIYREFWSRIIKSLTPEEERRIWHVAGILAAARSALTAEQVCAFTGITPDEFILARRIMQQYLDSAELENPNYPENPLIGYRIYHASFQEYLSAQPDFAIKNYHLRIAEYYLSIPEGPSHWDRYGLSFLPYHLLACERWEEMIDLLCSEDFLNARQSVANLSQYAIIEDYQQAIINASEPLWQRLWNAPLACTSLALSVISSLIDSGEIEQGKSLLERCKDILLSRASPELTSLWNCLAGRLAIYEGKMDQAELELSKALSLAREAGFSEGAAKAMLAIGVLVRKSYSSSLDTQNALQEALQSDFSAYDADFRSRALLNLCMVYVRKKQEKQASECLEKARNAVEESGNPILGAWLLKYAGFVSLLRQDIRLASEQFESASIVFIEQRHTKESRRCKELGICAMAPSVYMQVNERFLKVKFSGRALRDKDYELKIEKELESVKQSIALLEGIPEESDAHTIAANIQELDTLIDDFERRFDPEPPLYILLANWRGLENQEREIALRQLPRQLLEAKRWNELEALLTDLTFIEAKCAAGMTHDLVADYNAVLAATDAADYWSGRSHVEEFGRFVQSNAQILAERPALAFQQAANEPDASAPAIAAKARWDSGLEKRPWLQWVNKPQRTDPYTISLWDTEIGSKPTILVGHSDRVTDCGYSPDSKRIVSASYDKTLKVWDSRTGKIITIFEGHSRPVLACAYFPDGKRIVSTSMDGTLKLWDGETGKELITFDGYQPHTHSEGDLYCAFSPDGRRIVSTSYGWCLRVWDAETGSKVATLKGHRLNVRAIDYSPDGRWIVSGSDDGTLTVWDAETGRKVATVEHLGKVYACAYSPDGRRIVSGGTGGNSDKSLKVWDANTCVELATLSGHSDIVNACTYSPDGRRIISRSKDSTIKVWDAETGKVLITIEGKWPFKNSPDGKRIVSALGDHTLKVCDIETGAIIAMFVKKAGVNTVALGSDGLSVVAGDRFGNVYFLRLVGY